MEEQLVDCLRMAIENHVTDIHFTSKDDHVVIELRTRNGVRPLLPKQTDMQLLRYLMYRANINLANLFVPQTGSFHVIVDQVLYALRFALIHNEHMTSGVLRILNSSLDLTIDDLTNQIEIIDHFKTLIQETYGLYLFSGPTGSGKTTTLYTLLNAIEHKKIYTLEDPIEVVNAKYVQLQINEHQHFSYAEGIKQLMRHDPDIIMIGEIRDEVAANMAIRCALTGHLVMSSIHSFDCPATIDRMLELHGDKGQLKDVLKGVFNQRLITLDTGKRYAEYTYYDQQQITAYLS